MDFKDMWKKLVQFIINNIVWIILLTVASSVSNFIANIGKEDYSKISIFIMVISLVISILGLICIIMYFKYRRDVNSTKSKYNFDIKHTDIVSELNFNNRETITHRLSVKFSVLAESINRISHAIGWTGTKYGGSELEDNPRGYTLTDSKRNVSPHHLVIDFGRELKKTNDGDYVLKTKFSDPEHEMEPYLAHYVSCVKDKLTLRITAPSGIIRNVEYVECLDAEGQLMVGKPKKIQQKKINDLYVFEKTIDNPVLLHYYRLNWNFIC